MSNQNVTISSLPRQGGMLHRRVVVCFNQDTTKTIRGTVLRNDIEDPFTTIIRLDDGRHVLGSECAYHG